MKKVFVVLLGFILFLLPLKGGDFENVKITVATSDSYASQLELI